MRKLSAILLIGIFACSQYARHLSYLECRILNTLTPASQQCDCEKLVIPDKGEEPSKANHLHIHLEEFFDRPTVLWVTPFYPANNSIKYPPPSKEKAGYYSSCWQPPDRSLT